MRKTTSIFVIAILVFLSSSFLVVSNATTRDIKKYTVEELEGYFQDFCIKYKIVINNDITCGDFLRDFLLSEDYSSYDDKSIKLIRAYGAIYLNKEYLETNVSKISNKRDSNIKNLTINDISNYIKEEDKEQFINSRLKTKKDLGYSPKEASEYALLYVETGNKAYYDFTKEGGDCTNFVSQALSEGGIDQVVGGIYGTNGWFYKNVNNRSATWSGAQAFSIYWRKIVASYSANDKRDIIAIASQGDVIQYKEETTGLRYHTVLIIENIKDDIIIAQRTQNYKGKWSGRGIIGTHNGYETYFDILKFTA